MSMLDKLATALQAVVGSEALLTDATAVAAYTVDGVVPALVALPADEAQLADVLRLANEHQATVFPRGGGSHMALGQTPLQVDLVLSVQRLRQQLAYEPGDMTTTVQAGMCLHELQQRLGQQGQFLALDPPVTAVTTIGGVIATNASGPRRYLYGTARDVVLGMAVVGIDGTRTKAGGRVVKNVTGYDLNKLYIGSLGTLAVIVELTCKLHPLPSGEATLGIGYTHHTDTLPLLQLLTQLPLRLNSLELLNAAATTALTQRAHVVAPDTPYLLLARVEGTPEVTASQHQRLSVALRHVSLTSPATMHQWITEEQDRLWAGLAEFLHTAPGVCSKVSLLMSQLPTLCETVQALSPEVPCPLVAHAGNGIAYVNIPPADAAVADTQRLLAHLQTLDVSIVSLRGHRVIERAPAEIKRQCQVWGVPGDSFPLMQAIKTSFDPDCRLNPGRFIGGL
jgi:glycolate oxidase FAD binding subunit